MIALKQQTNKEQPTKQENKKNKKERDDDKERRVTQLFQSSKARGQLNHFTQRFQQRNHQVEVLMKEMMSKLLMIIINVVVIL